MWGVLLSALTKFTSWFFGAATIKWAFLAVLWVGVAALLDLLLELLPPWFGTSGLTGATSAFTPEVWYFLDYFDVSTGLGMVLSAYAIRFLIRRLPVIG